MQTLISNAEWENLINDYLCLYLNILTAKGMTCQPTVNVRAGSERALRCDVRVCRVVTVHCHFATVQIPCDDRAVAVQ
jgi:hypothetical protein